MDSSLALIPDDPNQIYFESQNGGMGRIQPRRRVHVDSSVLAPPVGSTYPLQLENAVYPFTPQYSEFITAPAITFSAR